MTGSFFSLRELAYAYCQFVSRHLDFTGGIDGYQVALSVALLVSLCGLAFLLNSRWRGLAGRLCPPSYIVCC
jgi:hypothetical protein